MWNEEGLQERVFIVPQLTSSISRTLVAVIGISGKAFPTAFTTAFTR